MTKWISAKLKWFFNHFSFFLSKPSLPSHHFRMVSISQCMRFALRMKTKFSNLVPPSLPSAPPLSRASLKPVKVKVGASEVQTHISPQTIEHFCFEVHSNRSFWFLKLISLGCKGNGKCASFQSQVYLLTHKQREWSRTWKEELVHVEWFYLADKVQAKKISVSFAFGSRERYKSKGLNPDL